MSINYIKQVWAHLRQDPVVSIISVLGTALSIFLIMVVVMMQQVKVASFSPVSNRDRLLFASWISFNNKSWGKASNNSPMSINTAKELYKSLKTPEAVSLYLSSEAAVLSANGVTPFVATIRQVDNDFFHVFDYKFVLGKPFDKATFDAGEHVVAITEEMAKKLFENGNAVGKEIYINHASYKVIGVIKNVSGLATPAYADILMPYTASDEVKEVCDELGGPVHAVILANNRNDFPAIRDEEKRLLSAYSPKIAGQGFSIINHNRPYTQLQETITPYANGDPDVAAYYRNLAIMFIVLLLVPAINLSSMTQSRLRKRIAEIGVRRAFGCTRTDLLRSIVSENFVLSLIAGILGLALSIAFAYFGASIVFSDGLFGYGDVSKIDLSILLQPSTFVYAFLFCFILNLISSIIPAWRASRADIVNALNGTIH